MPVAGEVYGMRVFALGEVVRPGEPSLNIVPEGAELKVMAQLEPIHVDQVHPGQEAVLRFSAFPARTTPEYAGRVARVSADACHDERTGLDWYDVELEMGARSSPTSRPASGHGRAGRRGRPRDGCAGTGLTRPGTGSPSARRRRLPSMRAISR